MIGSSHEVYEGLAISPGLAMGVVFVYRDILQREHEYYRIPEEDVAAEWARIENAVEEVRGELARTAQKVEKRVAGDASAIFLAQETMLQDPALTEDLKTTLHEERVNAEHVVMQVFLKWEQKFQELDREDLQQRGEDVADLARRLLVTLEGIHAHTLETMPEGSVLVARRLLPSDTVFLSRRSTIAVIVEHGGRVSHAAILTRELGVPGVAQLPDLLADVRAGDTVFVDGDRGRIIVRPDVTLRKELQEQIGKRRSQIEQAKATCREPVTTNSGRRVWVMANIGCKEDVEQAVLNGADGVGLYRTEHLYLSKRSPPSESSVVNNLRDALAPMKNMPLTLRLLDAGGDKNIPFINMPAEQNPFLGRRGIRLLLDHPDLLTAQLRAFMHLVDEYDISILVPMVTIAEEMAKTREIMLSVAQDMGCEKPPQLGAMIETPAAALCIPEIAKHADFFSVGTNDLTQYTMAAGRENPRVSDYFVDNHPAVIRLLKIVVEESDGCPVNLCGELASSPDTLETLINLGITTLSVAPPLIPALKERIRHL